MDPDILVIHPPSLQGKSFLENIFKSFVSCIYHKNYYYWQLTRPKKLQNLLKLR